jgi:hypothetical protein
VKFPFAKFGSLEYLAGIENGGFATFLGKTAVCYPLFRPVCCVDNATSQAQKKQRRLITSHRCHDNY